MKALPAFVLALAVTGASPSASADDTAVFAQLGVGGTGVYGDLGNSFDSQLTRSTVGLGARWGMVALTMDLNFDFRGSSEPELHSSDLVGLQYGPELRRFFTLDEETGQELYLRGGLHRVQWSGSSDVRRTCSQTGDCAGGFFAETPSYDGLSVRTGFGWQKTLPKTAGSSLHMAFYADLGLEQTYLTVVREPMQGTIISASFGMQIGGGGR